MFTETDLDRGNGRRLHVYDTCVADAPTRLTVFWHHGTPNVGEPPVPLLAASARLGIRWVSYDRPGYGGSNPRPGRNVASAAEDVTAIADALGIERFAVMGHSGGGPHALACAALLPDRVQAAVSVSGLAPMDAAGLDWFAGIADAGAAELRAAMSGGTALRDLLEATEFDPAQFTEADFAALSGEWGWLGSVAGKAGKSGPDPMVDDDLAYVNDWGFDPTRIESPVLFVHGDQDRVVPAAHSQWLSAHVPGAAPLWLRAGDGHISVLHAGEAALDWLVAHTPTG